MAPRLLERLLVLLGRGRPSRKPSGEVAALLLPMPHAARRQSCASVRRNHHSGE